VKRSANGATGSSVFHGTLLSALLCATTSPAVDYAATDWVSAAYYVTSQSYYHIEVETLDLGRAWRLGRLLEVQARLGAFHSQGERLDAPYLLSQDSTTSGATFGGAGRIYPLQLPQIRLFFEGSVEILYTPGGNQFPAGGTGINAFLRVGGGLQCPISQRLALEVHYEYAHISNGAGSVEQNPMWNGRGGGLTLRRAL
jgi:hypothetical protein